MKKIMISESEKNSIRKMYGLLSENLNQDLLDFANNYIDNKNCDEIFVDLSKFKNAVDSGQVTLSQDEKNELSQNLKDFENQVINAKFMKSAKCGIAKNEMKKSFKEQSQLQPDKLKTYMCWFADNITNSNLVSCKTTKNIQPEEPKNEKPDYIDKTSEVNKPQNTNRLQVPKPSEPKTQEIQSTSRLEKNSQNPQDSEKQSAAERYFETKDKSAANRYFDPNK